MNTLQTNYQALVTEENEVPHESVIFQAASEGGKPHWNHIGDLDTFFKNLQAWLLIVLAKVYKYHQSHGFTCIMTQEIKNIVLLFFIIFGLLYLMVGINYNFDEYPSPLANKTDIELADLFLSIPQCVKQFGPGMWIIAVLGILTVLWKCYKTWQIYITFDDIRRFYTSAMKIEENEICHMTWHQVQCKLRKVQHEQQMCVHKSDLTELDISHRILRQTNYLVAMVNKNILPAKFTIKFFGEWVYLTSGMEYILYLLFFSRFSPVFKETGKLQDEYKRYAKRKEAAANLAKVITILFAITVILCPVFMVYGIATFFIEYAGVMRFFPNHLSARQWSRYSKYYVRHFNELDHELGSRLNRAYKPANDYMKSFSSPLTVLLARTICQIAGSVTVFFLLWGIFKERLFVVPSVILIVSSCSAIFLAFQSLMPDENAVYFPEILMKKITAEIHYVPDHFQGNEQLPTVRDEFSQLYQYKFVALTEEILGALMIPYILYFHIRPRSLDIVDFFRNFTVEVSGVGDVCSFALMDVSRHGNNQWLNGVQTKADQHQQAEGGKTELSLIHFTLMNPEWKPPPASDVFISDFKQRVNIAREGQDIQDPYYASLNSLCTMGSKYASLVNSRHCSHHHHSADYHFPLAPDEMEVGAMSGNVSLTEGPPYLAKGGFLSSMHGDVGGPADSIGLNPSEVRAADMSFSALYIHEAHRRLNESSLSQPMHHRQPSQESESNENEASPLLEVNVVNYVQ